MSYDRVYYEDLNTHPFLFYVVFGVNMDDFSVSGERHHVDEIPEDVDLRILTKESNGEYMEGLIGQQIGNLLSKDKPELYEQVKETTTWAIFSGEVVKDVNLNYMKNTIGIIQALLETGAIGVLDLQTFSLYSSEEWKDKFFTPTFNPGSHVTILFSDMDDGSLWLHTRGLRKFGRPDVSIEDVSENDTKNATDIINQMIYYSSKGTFFKKSTKLHTPEGKSFIINPSFVEDYDNSDFNNAYYKLSWKECKECTETE